MTTPALATQQTQLTTIRTSENNTPPPATPTSPPVTSTSLQTMSTSQPLQSLKSGELEANIDQLQESFNDLVDSVESSFITTGVLLEKIQKSIKSIPVTLKLQLGECFKREAARFLKAESIEQIFFELSYFWDYLNPGLLRFLVNKFGSSDDKCSMKTYLQELSTFCQNVKIGDFIKASHAETNINNFIYTKMTMIMDQEWENKTLQDAKQFKIEVCNECHLPQSFTTRMCVQRSSVAIVFYLPCQIEICLEDLKPLLQRNKVAKVYVENVCVLDWTKQVCNSMHIALINSHPNCFTELIEHQVKFLTYLQYTIVPLTCILLYSIHNKC